MWLRLLAAGVSLAVDHGLWGVWAQDLGFLGSRAAGSVVVMHRLTCSVAWVFKTQVMHTQELHLYDFPFLFSCSTTTLHFALSLKNVPQALAMSICKEFLHFFPTVTRYSIV